MLNYVIDIIIIVIILLFVFMFMSRGLIASLLKSFSWLISIVLTYFLYPIISGIIRQTFIFESLKEFIYGVMELDSVSVESGAGQISAINSLTIPEALKNMLVDNNNSVIYELLGVKSLQEYIAGYIANIILNIVISILVFLVILLVIKAVKGTLNLAFKLPVLKQVNGFGGALLGLIWGVVFVWVIMSVSTLFIAAPFFSDMVLAIDNSLIGKILYDNNLIMNVLLAKLFGWG